MDVQQASPASITPTLTRTRILANFAVTTVTVKNSLGWWYQNVLVQNATQNERQDPAAASGHSDKAADEKNTQI